MKYIVVGLLVFMLGCGIAFGFYMWKGAKLIEYSDTPTPNESVPTTNFSLDKAPSDSVRGTIKEIEGDVWWESRTATQPAKLAKNTILQQGEKLIASDDGHLTVGFASTSAVMLSPNTEVEIIQTLPTSMVFNQLKGDVHYSTSGAEPISIRSLNMIATMVNGTMDIGVDPDTGDVVLDLQSGTATVAYNSPSFVSKVWDLSAGDTFEYNSNERKGYFK